jgi:hypothetical protein
MTGDQSRTLKVDDRVCWGVTTTDLGTVIGKSWSEVTIEWDDGEASSVSHNDMARVERVSVTPVCEMGVPARGYSRRKTFKDQFMRNPKRPEAALEAICPRATAPDLRESNNRPSPVARFIHCAASNVLGKGACLNKLGASASTPFQQPHTSRTSSFA